MTSFEKSWLLLRRFDFFREDLTSFEKRVDVFREDLTSFEKIWLLSRRCLSRRFDFFLEELTSYEKIWLLLGRFDSFREDSTSFEKIQLLLKIFIFWCHTKVMLIRKLTGNRVTVSWVRSTGDRSMYTVQLYVKQRAQNTSWEYSST